MKKSIKLLFYLWVRLIRSWKSPLLYWIFRYTKYRTASLPDKWDEVKDLDINSFHLKICLYDYLPDHLGGAIDFSPQEKDFFFLDRKNSRDCDNWSRMWYWYFKYHGIETKEIAMLDLYEKSAHMVTVAKFDDGWELFDYRPTNKKEDTIQEALKNNLVNYNNFVWTINKN